MRVALFGGTFDPPHRGHLGIATAAADAFALDRVLFAPTGQQPLKAGRSSSPFADRLAMVGLACKADPRFAASTVDAPRADGAPNYTVDTLAQLAGLMPRATLYNLVGADSLLSLRQWREPEKLLGLAEWIVVSRPGYPLADLSSLELTGAERSRVHLLETVHEDVSATVLRERLATGHNCGDLLPAAVASYIRSHGLYR
jgi:nicotinate (nicotinamide) nucleotide adenylyltransferase